MQERYLDELLRDETFINYCFKRNVQDVNDWENRIQANPDHKAQIEELKQIVIAMGFHAGNDDVDQNYLDLRKRITRNYQLKKKYILFFFGWITYTAAAIILIPTVLLFYGIADSPIQQIENKMRFTAHCKPGNYISVIFNQTIM